MDSIEALNNELERLHKMVIGVAKGVIRGYSKRHILSMLKEISEVNKGVNSTSGTNFDVEWGISGKGIAPSEKKVEREMERIRKKAEDTNVFSRYVTGPMYRLLKDRLTNSYIKLILSGDDAGKNPRDHWVLIGTDKDTVEASHRSI